MTIDIISHGYAVDIDTDPRQQYLIETWTFRVDPATLNDWMKSRPIDLYDLMPDDTPVEVIERKQTARTENRQLWCQRVLHRLLGRHVELGECEMYNITHVVTEIFAAARITRLDVDRPTIRQTNREKLLRELSDTNDAALANLLTAGRLLRRLTEVQCDDCFHKHHDTCPDGCLDGGKCTHASLADWLGEAVERDIDFIPREVRRL